MANRNDLAGGQQFRLGPYTVNPAERLIELDGRAIQIEPKVMDVLLVLVANAGEVVSREAFFNQVWPGATISDEALSRCIYQLRKFLQASPTGQTFIKTIPKKGYCLTLQPESLTSTSEAGKVRHHKLSHWWYLLGLGILAAASLLLFWSDIREDSPTQGRAQQAVNSFAIAVLPFTNLSSDPERSWLGDGFPEDLLIGISRHRSLQVSAWASSRRFHLGEYSSIQVGDALNVDALLTGTMRIEAQRMRVSVELIDAATGKQLWTNRYEDDLSDVHQIQNAIAQEVVHSLGLPGNDFHISSITHSLAAHELYIEGRYYLNRRNRGSLQQAIEYFNLAIETDPDFAEAYTGLADAHMLATQYQGSPLAEATNLAQAAVNQALALDSELAESVASQGLIFLHNNRFEEAASTLRLAAAMNPNYANAHNWLGRAVELQGQVSQALEAYRRGLRLDPMSTILNLNVARLLTYTGQLSQTGPYFNTLLKLDPEFPNTYWALGFNSYQSGDLDAAVNYFQQAFDAGLESPFAMADYAVVLTYRGDFDLAMEWLDRSQAIAFYGQTIAPRARLYMLQQKFDTWLEQAGSLTQHQPDNPSSWYHLAQAHLYREENSDALLAFEKGIAEDPQGQALFHKLGADHGNLLALDYALALQRMGEAEKALQVLEKADQLVAQRREAGVALPGLDYTESALQALLNLPESAMESFIHAADAGWPGAYWAGIDPKFGVLHDYAEFRRLTGSNANPRLVRL